MNTGGALLKRSSGHAVDAESGLTPTGKTEIQQPPQRCGGSRKKVVPERLNRLQRARATGYTLTVVKILPPPTSRSAKR